MNIVIIGVGKLGSALAADLLAEGHDITVIDVKSDAVETLSNTLDIMSVVGNGAHVAVQQEAGVKKSALLIACTPHDELNMLCCLIGKKLGAAKTISRVRTPEYFNQMTVIKEDLGLSMVVNPELAAADEIYRVLAFPAATKIELFAKGRVELIEYIIPEDSMLDGMSLTTLAKKYDIKLLVCAVRRDKSVYIPNGNFALKSGDKININASHKDVEKFFRTIGGYKTKVKTVLIVGGGRIGYYLANSLMSIGVKVKIIENDRDRCAVLSSLLPKVTVINGDGTDQSLLREEGIENVDAFVALTGIDEENIIMSLYASKETEAKTVAKINRQSYLEMAEELGIESMVSPKQLSANNVVSYVRAMENSTGANIEALYRLIDDEVEAIGFSVKEDVDYTDIPLKKLKLKRDYLIACIVRNRQIIIPNGDDHLEKDDSVLIVTTNSMVNDLSDIFENSGSVEK